MISEIASGYSADPWFTAPHRRTLHLRYDGVYLKTVSGRQVVIVPNVQSIRNRILREHHDIMLAGHPGIGKTQDSIMRNFWWPHISEDIRKYVLHCPVSQRDKVKVGRQHGLLQPLPIPSRPWESISMDYIVELPRTKTGFDSIAVFVDRLTKLTHFVPIHTTIDAEQAAVTFLKCVFASHGMPMSIICDRGFQWNSKFWLAVSDHLVIRTNMSTAFHPPTDGPTD